ncbi:MAG: YqjD family protein [Burkholderiales bacterium]
MNAPSEKLIADFKVLMTDIEELVKATAGQPGERIAEMRNRLQQAAADLKPRLAQAEMLLRDKAKAAAATTDDYVHDHPWTAMGVSAGIGLIIGLLIGRR